jgi:hypothetical protein
MRYVRSSGNPNFIVGIFLLVLLSMFAGPNLVPRLIASILPGFDEGVPCAWLKSSNNRAAHQSLLGRAASQPIGLAVRTSGISRDPAGIFSVTITVTNNSLGTVPLLFNANQVIVGDNGTSGLGLIFIPQNSLVLPGVRQGDPASFPETDLKLLTPRQSCVVRAEFPNGNVLIDPSITNGRPQVKAYYRVNSRGQTIPPAGVLATPIYPDQGLWTGYIESAPVDITIASQ